MLKSFQSNINRVFINDLKLESKQFILKEIQEEKSKITKITAKYVSQMSIEEQLYFFTARKEKIYSKLMWDYSVEYNINNEHFLIVRMNIPKDGLFKEFSDNRYVVFYDSNGIVVQNIFELWQKKSLYNTYNYFELVKDIFLYNRFLIKPNLNNFEGNIFVYNKDYTNTNSYKLENNEINNSNSKLKFTFKNNESKNKINKKVSNSISTIFSKTQINGETQTCIGWVFYYENEDGSKDIISFTPITCTTSCDAMSIGLKNIGMYKINCGGETVPKGGGTSGGGSTGAGEDGSVLAGEFDDKEKAKAEREEIKENLDDNISVQFPCLAAIMDKLKNINVGDFKNIVDKFKGDNPYFNVIYKTGDIGIKSYAITDPNTGINFLNGNYNTTITLNTKFFTGNKRMTDFGIMSTLIHETIHAYLVLYYNKDPLNFNLTYSELVNKYILEQSIKLNSTQHDIIAQFFIEPISDALRRLFPNYNDNEPIHYFTYLAWGGLLETTAYTQLPLGIKLLIESYNANEKNANLKTSYPEGTIINCN